MDPELYELLQGGEPGDEVAVVLRLHSPGRAPAGADIVARFGHVVTARVRRGDIPAVRADPAVASMKAPKSVSPDLERGLERGASLEESGDADLSLNDERRPDGLTQTGRGVVIGMLDWGCDFAHPDFRHPDGSTRLLALWDQRPRGESDALPYGYGRIHGAAQINAALLTPDPYAALGYHPADADPGLGAHGTHTLGIAGGNGRGGGPSGVAPEAHLVFVHLGAREGPDAVPLGNSAELLEGLDLIARVAAGRPCVVNLSLGRHAGEKTGRSLVERALDEWVTLGPGRAVVQSCGNYFERRTHAALTLRPGETHTLTVRVDPADRSPNELDLWYPGRDRLGVEVRAAGGDLVARAARGERAAASLDGREVLRVYHRAFDPNNGDHQINVQFEVVPGVHAWEVTLTGEDVQDGRVHAWIERDSACGSCQSRFPRSEADARFTLGTICTGYRTLAVGAHDPHRGGRPLGKFSSSGPTRDGRAKPDLIAPGVMILAPRSQGRGGGEGRLYTRMSGTSMAAPHVTGTVALMFGAAGPLDIARTRRILLASCDPAAPDLDPARVGSGYLDIGRAVRAAQALSSPRAQEASRMHETNPPAEDRPPEDALPLPGLLDLPGGPESGYLDADADGPPLELLEMDGDAPSEDTLSEDEAFASDVDAELTAFEFASLPEEEGGENEAAEDAAPETASWTNDRPPGLRFLERFEAGLGSGASPSAAAVLLEAARGEEDAEALWTELTREELRPPQVWDAFRGDGPSPARAALEPYLARVGAPGGRLDETGLLPGDLLVQRATGSPFTAVSVVREPGETGAPVWRAAAGEIRATHQRALDDAGRVAAHTVVLRPRHAESLPGDAEVAGPCADVTVPPARRPRLLIRGSVHPALREAQRKLSAFHRAQVARGLPGLTGAPLAEDCVFGPLTQGAVLDFQRQVFPGLNNEHDGKIGPRTWTQLDAVTLLPGPVPLAALTVEAPELLDDGFTRPLTWDDVIGLDVGWVNIRVAASGLPDAVMPTEIEVTVASRPPNRAAGPATLSAPVTLRLPRAPASLPGRPVYQLARTPGDLGAFLAVETRQKEVATLVRQPDHLGPGTSDQAFRDALGWAPRGQGTVPGSRSGNTGDAASETPDARKLFLAAGVEVLEVSAAPAPGLRLTGSGLTGTPARALIRSPADVVYYSGHGSSAHNCLLFEGVSREASCWLRPADLKPHWRSPLDLDVLILAGCSVLRVDFPMIGDPGGNGLAWAGLLTTRGGPLRAILGYGGGAPADARGGDDIARAMGARMAGGSRNFARDWLEVNEARRAWNAVALDTRGYWDFTAFHNIRGPRALPAPASGEAISEMGDPESGESADLSDLFFAGLRAVGAALGAQPLHLLQVMMAESGLRPDAHNRHGDASGLIQFMPATLLRLGWTAGHAAFRGLSAEGQLPFVERYYRPYAPAGLTSTARLYQATFLPATLSLGSAPDTVLTGRGGPYPRAYAANSGLDRRGDGTIRVSDLTAAVDRRCRGPRWEEARARLEGTSPLPPTPTPPGPTPTPQPGTRPTLRQGSRGAAVREAQAKLNAVHARELAAGRPGLTGAPLTVDGAFGPGTRGATVAFQQLAFPGQPREQDGVIGPKTWARLDEWAGGAGPVPTPPGPQPPQPQPPQPQPPQPTPPQPTPPDPTPPQPTPGDPAWTQLRADAVRIALEEFARWHPGGAARSETDPAMRAVLRGYWTEGAGLAGGAADRAIETRLAWSAAFISWVMRRAGAGRHFQYASGHTVYCAAAKRNRVRNERQNPFWLYRVTEYAPQPGDLVCTGRQDSGVTFDNVDDGQFRASHCDVVVEAAPGRLTVVGGNVGDTVGRKLIRVDAAGRVLTDGGQRQYYAVLRLRTDPAQE
jgi:subtilisin family serine protease